VNANEIICKCREEKEKKEKKKAKRRMLALLTRRYTFYTVLRILPLASSSTRTDRAVVAAIKLGSAQIVAVPPVRAEQPEQPAVDGSLDHRFSRARGRQQIATCRRGQNAS
jgi:hypothetical protein